jgi:hypothetical protein
MLRRVAGRGREAEAERRLLQRVYWWAFALRAGAGLAAYLSTFYTDTGLFEDASYYEHMGYYVANRWLTGRSGDLFQILPQYSRSATLLITMIAVFYYALDGLRAVPVLLLVYSAVTAFVPVYTYRVAQELGTSAVTARRAAWLVALAPSFTFWSGALYKEGLTLLALNAGTYHTLRLQSRWQVRSAVMIVASILVLWGVRFYLAVLMVAAVAVALLWSRSRAVSGSEKAGGLTLLARQTILAVLLVALMAGLGAVQSTEELLVETDGGILVELDRRRHWDANAAASGFLQEARISTPDEAMEYLPQGLLYFLTVPWPWQLGAMRQNAVIPETAVWLLLYPFIALGFLRGLRVNRAGTAFILIVTIGMSLFYAMLSGNVGSAYRMRCQVWLLWAPFAMWGWEAWRQSRTSQRVRSSASRLSVARRRVGPGRLPMST